MAKTKGLTYISEKKPQITFVGDKHPTTGHVVTFTWEEIAFHIEKRNPTIKVISFKITPSGLECFHEDSRFGSNLVNFI